MDMRDVRLYVQLERCGEDSSCTDQMKALHLRGVRMLLVSWAICSSQELCNPKHKQCVGSLKMESLHLVHTTVMLVLCLCC